MIALFLTGCFSAHADPAALAPGAPELLSAQATLADRLRTAQSVSEAVLALQTAWTRLTPGKTACESTPRLELAWRIEHFGAAWREATQAAIAQSSRVQQLQQAPTVSPLITPDRQAELSELYRAIEKEKVVFLEASAWQSRYVRPVLTACPAWELTPTGGVESGKTITRDEDVLPVAVLALGDGYVCPGGQRAEGAVVLARSGRACWSETAGCNCEVVPVLPGAVLGPVLVSQPAE